MFENRIAKYLGEPAKGFTPGGDFALSAKTAAVSVAHQFGGTLRNRCEAMGVSRDQFLAMARDKFPVLNPVTFGRWWDGEKLPQTDYRPWFSATFQIEVPNKRNGKARVIKPPTAGGPNDFMEYAVGSLATAIKSTDAQILHDVKDSLSDPAANPWMRMAVTLVRQAHLRR